MVFGTDNDLEQTPNYLIIRHSAFPLEDPRPGDADFDAQHNIPCAKVMGEHRGRKHAFRPESVINLSAMSYGSLSSAAVEALNRGAHIASCLHNTGEGGISKYHQHGADLVWQIGTGYFGCRDTNGRFDFQKFVDTAQANPVRAIEIKLSQGAKPGRGGLLPAAKITPEIAEIRGIPMGRDCNSPGGHKEFRDVDSMLDFVERLAEGTGLPVGIKSAVGQMSFWHDLAQQMVDTDRGVDFITIDGGEGGTGAAPLVFTDHVALPFKVAMSSVFKVMKEANIDERLIMIGSGKLGFPESALFAFGLGCDMINVGREAMLSIGCIQAQRCHTGHCPAGVATQNKWLMSGLNPSDKSHRFANYIVSLRKEIMEVSRACGVAHPSQITIDLFDILDASLMTRNAADCIDTSGSAANGKYTGVMI